LNNKAVEQSVINVFHIVSNKIWSGPEQYTYDLLSRMRHDDYYVEVVCKKNDSIIAQYRHLEIPISILPLKGLTDLDSPVRFARLLKKGKNIVHVHSFRDAFTAVLAKHISENPDTHVIMTIHGINKPKNKYLLRKLYKEVDKFIFVSQFACDSFMGRIKRIDRSKGIVIRDSVLENTNEENKVINLRKALDVKPGQKLILYHGRLSHDKGIDVVLRALTQLDKNSYRMAVIGEGQPKFVSQLKAFIVANQMVQNVRFLGFSEDIHSLVDQCDFGVLPSVAPEALGLTNLEYMMHGKALITTNNGAQNEYIKDGVNGILVEPNNYFEVATAIKSLIDDKDKCKKMGAQAKKDFDENLNYDFFYKQITDLYKETVD
jgi:glycosyltransferase involved in cell wall biosynthesis